MKGNNSKFYIFLLVVMFVTCSCGGDGKGGVPDPAPGPGPDPTPPDPGPAPVEVIYDDTRSVYKTYDGLVMAGYQGWFTAEGDAAGRGWHHYEKGGQFKPGNTNVDFWPDVTEYTTTYPTQFVYPAGHAKAGQFAHVYSPMDQSTVDLHFKWMRDYGIDGVFMQRFVDEIKGTKGKNHFNTVLGWALEAARKYNRAICVMYDLSGCVTSRGDINVLVQDWEELQETFKLFDNEENPTYLWHNGRPLMTIWGVGFNDNRQYSTPDVSAAVDKIKGPTKKCSVMLGVPYRWLTGGGDTQPTTTELHDLIKKCDFIMPWAVGRYNETSYDDVSSQMYSDLAWCASNKIGYAPLCFPGFSWANMQSVFNAAKYDEIPRNKGNFLWKQMYGAKTKGAKSLYIAMFDEIDEGTAIFKCALDKDLPLNGTPPSRFVGIEDDLQSDHYLWLVGEGNKMMKGEIPATAVMPQRPAAMP